MPVMYYFYYFILCVADSSWSLASGLFTWPSGPSAFGLSTWPLGPSAFRLFTWLPGPISFWASPLHDSLDIITLVCMLVWY